MESELPAVSLKLIDADVHNAVAKGSDLLPFLPKYWSYLAGIPRFGIPGHSWHSPTGVFRTDATPPGGGVPGSDPAFTVTDHLDRYQIDYAILTGSGILGLSVHPDPDLGNVLASAYNEWLAHAWLPVSPRFKGSIVINHSDPAAAVSEIHKWGAHPDMVQVLMTSASNRLFGQRFYHPIYEAAESHGLPVAVHPGAEGQGIAGAPTPAGMPTRYMEWHNILPANAMAHINSLVCEGVFEKYPGLTFIAMEGGIGWMPHLMWRMDKNYKALRSQTPWLKRLPSEIIRDHIKVTTQPIEEPEDPRQLLQIFEMIGAPQMILFSSDYPHWDFDNPKMAFPALPREWKERIFWRNAAELYGLAVPATPTPAAS